MNEENILSIDKLGIRFGGVVALQDVAFSIKRGSISALIGPNGAGKTTLFNCLTGFYTPTHGEILFRPHDKIINIRHCRGFFGGSHRIAQAGIARTFQTVRLFKEMTVIENLLVAQHLHVNRHLIAGLFNTKAYAKKEQEAIDIAYTWLKRFHLEKDANRLAQELSFGQQRHLEIARAMCTRPSLLCLDEPAAGLNMHETHELSDIILELKSTQPLTILLIEHDMSLVMKISDHIVVLDHGHVISQGDPNTIRQDKRVIAAYLGQENHV